MADDNDEHSDIFPPPRYHKMGHEYDADRALVIASRTIPEGWGFANIVESLRNRSAARLAAARRHKVEEWERFLAALNRLGREMVEYERTRRSLENLDVTLNEEEAHNTRIRRAAREREIEDAETALAESRRRRREAERALERANGSTEQKERPSKPDPAERIQRNHAMRQRLRAECDAMVNEILAAARASGTENSADVQREIDNIKADFAKAIADTYEGG